MPVLWAYARDLFQTPGFGDTIDFAQIKRHYYVVHNDINPTDRAAGPDPSGWLTPHFRESSEVGPSVTAPAGPAGSGRRPGR